MSKKIKFTPNCEKGAKIQNNIFCGSGWIIYTRYRKSWGERAAGARLIQESEVTTPKSGLFKMVKMQKCARAARAKTRAWTRAKKLGIYKFLQKKYWAYTIKNHRAIVFYFWCFFFPHGTRGSDSAIGLSAILVAVNVLNMICESFDGRDTN